MKLSTMKRPRKSLVSALAGDYIGQLSDRALTV